jgi:hypothetical protein
VQDNYAKTMEGSDQDSPLQIRAKSSLNALPHLLSGLIAEREDQNRLRMNATLLDEKRDPAEESLGLPGTRARIDDYGAAELLGRLFLVRRTWCFSIWLGVIVSSDV